MTFAPALREARAVPRNPLGYRPTKVAPRAEVDSRNQKAESAEVPGTSYVGVGWPTTLAILGGPGPPGALLRVDYPRLEVPCHLCRQSAAASSSATDVRSPFCCRGSSDRPAAISTVCLRKKPERWLAWRGARKNYPLE